MTKLGDRARGRWQGILTAIGLPSRYLTGKNTSCPLPGCPDGGGKDRFRYVDKKGDGFWICSKCGSGEGIELVKRWKGVDFIGAAKLIEEVIGDAREIKPKPRNDDKRRAALNELWGTASSISRADPAGLYLEKRGVLIDAAMTGKALRLILNRKYADTDQHLPCMVAKVVAANGVPVTVHQTYLAPTGTKAEVERPRKLFWGDHPDGSAVRLMPARDGVLGIAEGIETALAAAKMFGVPVWATLNTHHMRTFVPPKAVTKLFVFGDNDVSFAGAAAAYHCAERTMARRDDVSVEVLIPSEEGDDWADVLSRGLIKSPPYPKMATTSTMQGELIGG